MESKRNVFVSIQQRTIYSLILIGIIGITGFLMYNDTQNDPIDKRPFVTWSDDPAHEIMITWEREIPNTGSVVYHMANSEIETTVFDTSNQYIHTINITGLNANSEYDYEVFHGDTKYGSGTFRTAPDDEATTFKWVMTSDTQQPVISPGHHYRIAKAIENQDYAFMTIVGDMVDNGEDQALWDNFFSTASIYTDSIPFIPVIGNHDWYGENNSLFFNYFKNNAETSEKNLFYYSFNYSMVHFTICHYMYGRPGEMQPEQLEWLEQDLKNAQDKPFRIVLFHGPIYGSAFFSLNEALTESVRPLMHKYNVSAVINGHEHHYERGIYPDEANLGSDVNYFVLGGGGGAFDPGIRPTEYANAYTISPCYTEVLATSTELTFRTLTPEGTLLDEYQITKEVES